ncbi:SlyX family protein [Endothiovibrio diazotrophicus]
MEDRLIELETRIAFQEGTLQELNEVLIEQRNEIDRLRSEVERLQERVKAFAASPVEGGREPPPPHY